MFCVFFGEKKYQWDRDGVPCHERPGPMPPPRRRCMRKDRGRTRARAVCRGVAGRVGAALPSSPSPPPLLKPPTPEIRTENLASARAGGAPRRASGGADGVGFRVDAVVFGILEFGLDDVVDEGGEDDDGRLRWVAKFAPKARERAAPSPEPRASARETDAAANEEPGEVLRLTEDEGPLRDLAPPVPLLDPEVLLHVRLAACDERAPGSATRPRPFLRARPVDLR